LYALERSENDYKSRLGTWQLTARHTSRSTLIFKHINFGLFFTSWDCIIS